MSSKPINNKNKLINNNIDNIDNNNINDTINKNKNKKIESIHNINNNVYLKINQTHSILLNLIQSALKNNPSILAKKIDYLTSQKAIETAQWQYYPSMSVSSELSKGTNTYTTNKLSNISVQQPLWNGGRTNNNILLSKLKAAYAQINMSESSNNLSLDILDAWESLLLSHGRIVATDKHIKRLQQLNETINRRILQTVSPTIDAHLISSRLLQSQNEYINYTNTYNNAYQRLEQLVGDTSILKQSIDSILLSSTALESLIISIDKIPIDNDDYLKLLNNIDQHPSIQKKIIELEIAKIDIKLKKSNLLPVIYARLERQFNQASFFNPRSTNNSAQINLQWSTGAGLSALSEINSASIYLDSLIYSQKAIKQDIQQRFTAQWNSYVSSTKMMAKSRLINQNQAALLNSNNRLFIVGRRSWLELLNAVKETEQAEYNISDLQAKIYTAIFRLYILSDNINNIINNTVDNTVNNAVDNTMNNK